MSGFSASGSPSSLSLFHMNKTPSSCYSSEFSCSILPSCSSIRKLKGLRFCGANESNKINLLCNSSTKPDGSTSGDNESKSVLDAFFLGKALADVLTERIESGIGEILSGISRLQAEQQKQLEDFQEEVLERAQKAKDKAASEAMEAQGLISKLPPPPPTNATTIPSSPIPIIDSDSFDSSMPKQPSSPDKSDPYSAKPGL